jgi:hypothetical protein
MNINMPLFLFPTEYMDLFLYINRISWAACYYGTIFIFVQFIRVIKEHFVPEAHLGFEASPGIGISWTLFGCYSLSLYMPTPQPSNNFIYKGYLF